MADQTDALEAITASVKQARKPTPRWLWRLAAVVGVGCALAFAVALLETPEPSGPTTELRAAQSGRGFGAGIVIGLVAGAGIGLAIGRRHRSTSSSRRIP